jgi:hypothetical protein
MSGTKGHSMRDVEIQFENTKKNRDMLLDDLFESNGWSAGMTKVIPGGVTIVLKEVPLQKAIGTESLIAVGLVFASETIAKVAAEWLSKKFSAHGQTKIYVNQKSIETTPEGLTRSLETEIRIEKR